MKRYKVLLISALDKPWNNGWYYKAGLEKNGHQVVCFDPAAHSEPRGKALNIIKELNPDFILHTKNELPADAFREFMLFTKVIHWYPDPVIPEWLPEYVKNSDIFLTMSEGLVEEFRKFNPNVFWLTQAFEPSFFEIKEITEKDRREFSSDAAFVGNLSSKKQYLSRRKTLEKVIDSGVRLKWWGPGIPRKFSTIPLLLGRLGRAYGGKFVWGEEYAKISKLSKIFLAFDSMPHIRKSMSARMYTAVGCGAFYMCQHVDGIEEVLEPGKEIVTFRDEDEMVGMIKYYLGSEALRQKIAEAGQKRVLREHTYEIRVNQMMKMVEELIG